MAGPPGTPLVLYDAVCGLCDRLIRFVLARDRSGRFRFAPLQGPLARDLLLRYGRDPDDLDSVYVVAGWKTADERLLARSRAVLYVLGQLGAGWRLAARLGAAVPVRLADAAYNIVARIRYRVFGRYEACPIPPREWRERFLQRQEP